MIFFRKQDDIEAQVGRYCDTILECLNKFCDAIRHHCERSNWEEVKKSFAEVHQSESLADDIRRDVEVMMYAKALFPESRGDILGLLETMDHVPNQMESVVRMIYEQRIEVPESFNEDLLSLVDVSARCVETMLASVRKLFSDYTSAVTMVGKIDELETEVDHLESAMIERAFAGNGKDMWKLLFRDLIRNIGNISDRTERVADRLRLIVAKRGI